jgi:hypothetical protein
MLEKRTALTMEAYTNPNTGKRWTDAEESTIAQIMADDGCPRLEAIRKMRRAESSANRQEELLKKKDHWGFLYGLDAMEYIALSPRTGSLSKARCAKLVFPPAQLAPDESTTRGDVTEQGSSYQTRLPDGTVHSFADAAEYDAYTGTFIADPVAARASIGWTAKPEPGIPNGDPNQTFRNATGDIEVSVSIKEISEIPDRENDPTRYENSGQPVDVSVVIPAPQDPATPNDTDSGSPRKSRPAHRPEEGPRQVIGGENEADARAPRAAKTGRHCVRKKVAGGFGAGFGSADKKGQSCEAWSGIQSPTGKLHLGAGWQMQFLRPFVWQRRPD